MNTSSHRVSGPLAAMVALLAASTVCAASGNLRAGAAKVDITPPKEMFPLTAGQTYGSANDPIYARALVLDNGTKKVALVSVDAGQVPNGNDVIQAVTQELGITREQLMISATHNHNTPASGGTRPDSPYYPILKKGIVEAVKQANAGLQPARIGFGTGKAYVNTNRDEKIGEGYHMGYVPEGSSDKTVAVVSITKPSGEPIAVYANYAVHAVVMYRSKTKDGHVQITGDLPGWTSRYVEERLGNNAVALWTSGAAGDQNPLFMSTYNQDHPDVFDEGPAGWAILDVQSRRLGEEIVRVTQHVKNTSDKAVLWGVTGSLTCPGRRRAEPPKPGEAPGGYLAPVNVKMIDGDPVTIPFTVLMINDIALAGVSAEVFTEIGQALKRESPFDRTMMVTLMPNGIGYIPTDEAFTWPAEKALTNRLKPGCAEQGVVKTLNGMMQQYLPVWNAAK